MQAGQIQALKGMGLGLALIREILIKYTDAEELEHFLILKRNELEEQHKDMIAKFVCLTVLLTG